MTERKAYTLDLKGAIEAGANGEIETWVLEFLDSDPYQKKLAPAYRAQTNFWAGPLEYPLSQMQRIAGVEEGMLYPTTPEKFEARVKKILDSLNDGWQPTPLILSDYWGGIHISDGNHRHEALLRIGATKYWVIFQSQTKSGIENFLKTIT